MTRYTTEEKVAIVKLCVNNSYRRTADIFAEQFPNRPKPSHTTVMDLFNKFNKTGSVDNIKHGSPVTVTIEENATTV